MLSAYQVKLYSLVLLADKLVLIRALEHLIRHPGSINHYGLGLKHLAEVWSTVSSITGWPVMTIQLMVHLITVDYH